MEKMPAFFIPHGWGPWSFMKEYENDKWYNSLRKYLEKISKNLNSKPKLIVIFSAHWEEKEFTIITNKNPELLYDYYWFPENTYNLEWSARWDLEYSKKIIEILEKNGINVLWDENRNYDHWVFIPLSVIYPDIDIPVIQISLKKWLNPLEHIDLWKALSFLRKEWVLFIGSWMNYHNMRWFFTQKWLYYSRNFNNSLEKSILKSENERNEDLINWKNLDNSLDCHHREEHLIPLMVISWIAWNSKWVIDFKEEVLWVELISIKF